jgi:diadenosine tetraphosphate (Ap4A) HIT family hydrolase
MSLKEQRKSEHSKRNCLFCDPQLIKQEQYRILNVKYSNDCFAILDKSPKVLGHTLVVSFSPFDDLTDVLSDVDEIEKTRTFESAIILARKIKRALGAEKVYIMLMSEKWEMGETSTGTTSEHFHFHLVPRYPGMRNKLEAAEHLLAREGTDIDKTSLTKIADLINSINLG